MCARWSPSACHSPEDPRCPRVAPRGTMPGWIMVQASVPEWDYVSHNSVLCSSVSTSSCDAFWLGRSGAAYVLRIPRACSSSCRLCCTCKRSQSCSVNTQQRSKQVPQGPGGKGGGPNQVQRETPAWGRSPWSRSICTQLPEPTAGSRTQLYAPLQDSQQHQSSSGKHKGQNSSGSVKALAVLSKPAQTPPLPQRNVSTVRSGSYP